MNKLLLILIWILLTSPLSADEPSQIPAEEDFFIGQIVNVNVGRWTTGMIIDYDGETGTYKLHTSFFHTGGHSAYVERKGSQLRARSPKRKLEVLPDNPPIQNIKAEVEEIKPEFKFNIGDKVVITGQKRTFKRENSRITGRAVLWGKAIYHVESTILAPAWDGQIHRQSAWDTVEEIDLESPPKEQPEYVEGLQP